MLIIPSLQLEPDFNRVYAGSVAETLLDWERSGFQRAQVVLSGSDRLASDSRMVEEILRDHHCPVQVSGPIESGDDIEVVLAAGAAFVVLGTRALDEPDWLSSVAAQFPDQLVISAPARERRMRSRGAVRTLPLDLRDIAGEMSGFRLGGLIVDFPPDAEMNHADLALVEDVVDDLDFPVLVSGGTPTLASLRDLDFRGAAGVIIPAPHLSAAFDEQALARSFSE
jgi:phosphoribosylformimino-5-aminoimidazole carboxamide ribotide isomerase